MKTSNYISLFRLLIVLSILSIFIGCIPSTADERHYYIESKPSFFELHNGSWLENKWLRKPENLLAIHETFKKFGYLNLISGDLLNDNECLLHGIYIKRPVKHLLDSLELTYPQRHIQEKYYRQFWQRRKAEKNDMIVYKIIKEINLALSSTDLKQKINERVVNDTLIKLLEIEYPKGQINTRLATLHFEVLKSYGLHQSAYNLLYEIGRYQGVELPRENLERSLLKSPAYEVAWFQDDAK